MPTDDQDARLYPFTPPPPPPSGSSGGEAGRADAEGPSGPHGSAGRRPKPSRRSRVTKAAAGLVLVLGAGSGAAVVLTSSPGQAGSLASASASTSTTNVPPSARPGRGFSSRGRSGFFGGGLGGRGFGAFGGFPSQGGLVHATYTVQGPNGTYETLDAQVGTVESVSSSSISVKSADGYSQQYSVTSSTVVYANYDGISSVNKGDDVAVVGLVGSSGVTAERVIDITQVQSNGKSWEPKPPTPPTTTSPSGGSTMGSFNGDDPGPAA